jgi:G:T/U-mismatch repair DNA glycosylase
MEINLNEILHPKMDILFVALNPPKNSNSNGKYFSNNLSFWNVLYNSGLIIHPIYDKLKGEELVFHNNKINFQKAIYGITDLVHNVVETNSNKVKVRQHQVERILKITEKHEIRKLCLMHSKVTKAFEKAGIINSSTGYGLDGKYKNTSIYKVPFHNASIENKEQFYKQLIH